MKTNLHIFRIPLLLLLIVAACTKEKTPSLSIDGKTAYTLESGSVRLNIKLIANSADWTCDTGADWISLLSREAAQATLLVAENPGFDAREATVSFRAGQASAQLVFSVLTKSDRRSEYRNAPDSSVIRIPPTSSRKKRKSVSL